MTTSKEQPVVTWHGGNGYYVLEIYETGRLIYQQKAGGFGRPAIAPPPIMGTMAADELRSLEALLRGHAESLRTYRPELRNPVPEEERQTLIVRWNEMDLCVEMMSGDWSREPAHHDCEGTLHLLAVRCQKNKQR